MININNIGPDVLRAAHLGENSGPEKPKHASTNAGMTVGKY